MKRQLEIDYSFGYVFDKSKLIVMYPVGSNVMDEEDYEMEVEVAFLEDGIEVAFEDSDIENANAFIKPLHNFLTKPTKIIPFVTSIKDASTKEELKKLMNDFDEEYEIKDNYINKGYEIQDVYYVFENVVKYIPKENIETLNILKIEKDKFDMESFVKKTQENLDEALDLKVINMMKSPLTDRLFIKNDEGKSKYIVFATDINSYSKGILCANSDTITDTDCDMADLEISSTMDVGYIIDEVDGYLTFKIANFNSETANKHQLAQVIDYSGIFKPVMIDFVNQFIK